MRNATHLLHPADPEFDEIGEAPLSPLIAEIISGLGEDVTREGLVKTPHRVARSLQFLTSGYGVSIKETVNGALFTAEGDDELVVVKNIEFYSLCEHHLLPFFGKAHIGYIPDKKILGLSKFARIVDVFARRLQLQERMTGQIADALVSVLEPKGVAVVTEASHLCMMMRGVEKQGLLDSHERAARRVQGRRADPARVFRRRSLSRVRHRPTNLPSVPGRGDVFESPLQNPSRFAGRGIASRRRCSQLPSAHRGCYGRRGEGCGPWVVGKSTKISEFERPTFEPHTFCGCATGDVSPVFRFYQAASLPGSLVAACFTS